MTPRQNENIQQTIDDINKMRAFSDDFDSRIKDNFILLIAQLCEVNCHEGPVYLIKQSKGKIILCSLPLIPNLQPSKINSIISIALIILPHQILGNIIDQLETLIDEIVSDDTQYSNQQYRLATDVIVSLLKVYGIDFNEHKGMNLTPVNEFISSLETFKKLISDHSDQIPSNTLPIVQYYISELLDKFKIDWEPIF